MTTASWPGLSRPSTSWRPLRKKDVDVRHPSTPVLRRAFSVLGRRSFSEGGKAGHDELHHRAPFHWLLFESYSQDEEEMTCCFIPKPFQALNRRPPQEHLSHAHMHLRRGRRRQSFCGAARAGRP